ncbi:hypothetical protein A0H81_06197 [Grifola frondosa]|uniref:Uncharacterized protein n=1 Tax=Grifola frondosa TaxID=5627 RepID=A0A1C7MA65_GRIFR|nr:hypothetical protein A0H81_06197 [Grifola frondosa]
MLIVLNQRPLVACTRHLLSAVVNIPHVATTAVTKDRIRTGYHTCSSIRSYPISRKQISKRCNPAIGNPSVRRREDIGLKCTCYQLFTKTIPAKSCHSYQIQHHVVVIFPRPRLGSEAHKSHDRWDDSSSFDLLAGDEHWDIFNIPALTFDWSATSHATMDKVAEVRAHRRDWEVRTSRRRLYSQHLSPLKAP